MPSSERPSPEPILKKEASPAVLGGGENSGNALEASNALNYRVWGIRAVLLKEIPGNALRAFPSSFRSFSGISSGKSQPYWGCGPKSAQKNCTKNRCEDQAPKKGININNFARNPPPRPPPPRDPWPRKFFMFGASFPFKMQEKAQT